MKKRITPFILTVVMMYAMAANATAYDEANWFVSVDIQQVRTKVLPLLPDRNESYQIANTMPEEAQTITLYGHSEVEDDVSMAVTGTFASFSFSDFLNAQLLRMGEQGKVSLYETTPYQDSLIEQYVFEEKRGDVSIYSAKVNNNLLILSLHQQEVKNWIDQKYSMYDLKNTGLVSLLVNVESAMAKVGADLKDHEGPFQSTLFKKIVQFSASVYESGDQLSLEASLGTADADSAKQMEQVINGLIAMNALSDIDKDKPVLAALMAGLNISNHGHELLISTGLPFALLSEIDVD